MSRTFAEVASPKKGRHKGCPRCGAERNVGAVSVYLQRLGTQGQISGGGGRIASRMISLCESCSVEVYEAIRDVLLAETKAA